MIGKAPIVSMPHWGGIIPPDQLAQLVAYIGPCSPASESPSADGGEGRSRARREHRPGRGAPGRRHGPVRDRYAGLETRIRGLGRDYLDLGNVEAGVFEAEPVGDPKLRFLPQIMATCERIADTVVETVGGGRFPLVLGGDHSVGLGTLGGLARAHGQPGGVMWIDAHGDLNNAKTTPSGNVHGMALAAAAGLAGSAFESRAWPLPCVDPTRIALVGTRDLDHGERSLIRASRMTVFTMSDIDRQGIEHAIRTSLAAIAGPGFVHVSLDLDALDPEIAPGVGTPVRGGLSYREAHLAMELIAESGLLSALDVVEVNPILDEHNETAKLAVELIASALGARIL